tara:strand:+ start:17 stop:922 length:906 start_codon:yes stop_codon:yes gene_type:complete
MNLGIVIPYYKITFFEETIASLANQTNKNFKVYIGNDASPECPEALLEQYKDKFNFIYKKFETNLGSTSLVKQWERCIDMIEQEEWIMILGDDDYLSNDVVEHWYSNYDEFKGSTNLVRFSTRVNEHGSISKNYEHPKWENAINSFLRKLKGECRSSLSEHIFSRTVYEKYKFIDFPLAWHSDDQAWLDFVENLPIYSINDTAIYIRISNESITGKKNNFDKKNVALGLFCETNIKHKRFNYFPKQLKYYFLIRYESYLKVHKKIVLKDWIFLYWKYLNDFEFISFMKLNRRFLLHIFKNR